jgi:hypothetical protein
VESNAALVETQSTNVIENQRILELPLNGPQATDLIQLAGAAIPQGTAGGAVSPTPGRVERWRGGPQTGALRKKA